MNIINFAIGFQLINAALFAFCVGASIYSFVLFVKLARRGIRALDVYLDKNSET